MKVGDLHLHALVAQVDITCVPAARPGISMSRLRIRQIAVMQRKPAHTKPGRQHEKTSWLHQEIPVVHMALGWATGKLGLMPGWAANSPHYAELGIIPKPPVEQTPQIAIRSAFLPIVS